MPPTLAAQQIKRVVTGQPLEIPAQDYNAFADAADHFRARQRGLGFNGRSQPDRAGIVLVRNDSGADRRRFDVLGIDGPLIHPAENSADFSSRVTVKGVIPKEEHRGKYVVLQEPIPKDQCGKACIDGVCVARIVSPVGEHQYADIEDGNPDALASGYSGHARILWKRESISYEQLAIIRIGAPLPAYIGKLDGVLDSGQSAEMLIWAGDPPADTEERVTVHDWMLKSGDSFPIGTKVVVLGIDGRLYVISGACD